MYNDLCACVCRHAQAALALCHSIRGRVEDLSEVLLGQGQPGNLGNMSLGQLSLLLNA